MLPTDPAWDTIFHQFICPFIHFFHSDISHVFDLSCSTVCSINTYLLLYYSVCTNLILFYLLQIYMNKFELYLSVFCLKCEPKKCPIHQSTQCIHIIYHIFPMATLCCLGLLQGVLELTEAGSGTH